MTTYWLYVDDVTNRLRIHEGPCRYCNHGRGVNLSRLPDNRWIGPFAMVADVVDKAKRIGKRDAAGCGECLPGLVID